MLGTPSHTAAAALPYCFCLVLQTYTGRPDLVARVFRLKLKSILEDLLGNDVLGVVIGYIYVIEFQKRGLPHARILLIMAPQHLLHSPDQYMTPFSAQSFLTSSPTPNCSRLSPGMPIYICSDYVPTCGTQDLLLIINNMVVT